MPNRGKPHRALTVVKKQEQLQVWTVWGIKLASLNESHSGAVTLRLLEAYNKDYSWATIVTCYFFVPNNTDTERIFYFYAC